MATEKRLIDANALIDWIDMGHLRNPLETCYSERDVVDMLESRPTVDAVEVVHGRWNKETDMDEDWGEMDYYKCSVCGKCQFGETNYCPNCGAKMDGDGNERC